MDRECRQVQKTAGRSTGFAFCARVGHLKGMHLIFRRLLLLSICTILLFCCAVSPVFAQKGGARFTVYPGQLPPLNYMNDQGQWQGAAVKTLRRIMRRSSVPLSGVDFQSVPWARAVFLGRTEPGSVVISIARTPERDEQFRWVGPVVIMRLGLIAKKERHLAIDGPEDMRGLRTAVIRESAPLTILREWAQVEQDELLVANNNLQQFRLLHRGRVDMVTHTDLSTPIFLNQLDLDPEEYEMVHVLRELPLYFAFHPDTDESLLGRLQKELEQMKKPDDTGISEFDRLLKKELGKGPVELSSP